MPYAYCTTCDATVTVSDGNCLAGHTITTPIQTSGRGRHRAPSRLDRLRAGKIKTAQHYRRARTEKPAPRKKDDRKTPPEAPQVKQARVPQPRPAPVRPQPAPVTWQPAEVAPRPAYNSSLLEMLGMDEEVLVEPAYVAPPAPQPLWQAPAPVETVRRVGVERLPSLSDMQTVNDNHTDTGTLIERLWVATEEHEAVRQATDLQAGEFSELPNRTFRWSIIIGAVLVLAIAVGALQIGVQMPARIADDAVAAYQAALTDAQAVIPAAEEVMAAITNPAVTTEGLSDAAVALSELDTASRALFTVASEPLSSTPPLVSRDELDALTPIRTDMANASQDGLAIERRLGDALTYRLVFAKTFNIPGLPSTASPEEISTLGVELGLGLAATLDALQALPNDPAFERHRLAAEALADRFAEWQIEYLSALRSSDVATAISLAEELENGIESIHAGIDQPLAVIAGWATKEIRTFSSTLEGIETRLPSR